VGSCRVDGEEVVGACRGGGAAAACAGGRAALGAATGSREQLPGRPLLKVPRSGAGATAAASTVAATAAMRSTTPPKSCLTSLGGHVARDDA